MLKKVHQGLNDTTHQVVLGVFLACAFVAVLEAAQWTNGWRTRVTENDDGITQVKIAHQRDHLEARFKGEITFTDDEGGIEHLGLGAKFELEERASGQRRRLEVTRGAEGTPEIAFFLGRKEAPFDAAAQDWLRQTLPQLYRRAGLDAEGRVARILARGGVEAVLQEITEIPSDHVQGLYFQHLMGQAVPEDGDLVQTLDLAAQEVRSDVEQARFLSLLPIERLHHQDVASSFVAVVETISSDFELRRTLSELLKDQELDPSLAEVLLEAGQGIDSDFEMASFLLALAETYPESAPLPTSFVAALETIGSDFELRRVIRTVLEGHRQIDTLDLLLTAAEGISSDYEQGEFLVGFTAVYPHGMPLPSAFFHRLETLDTDFEQRKVLAAVLERPQLDQDTLGSVLRSAAQINSDFERAELLLRVVQNQALGEELRPLLEEVLQGMGSDFERQRVEAALADAPANAPAESPAITPADSPGIET